MAASCSAKPSVECCMWDGMTSCSSAGRGCGLNGKHLSRKGLVDIVDSKLNASQQVPLWKETCLQQNHSVWFGLY